MPETRSGKSSSPPVNEMEREPETLEAAEPVDLRRRLRAEKLRLLKLQNEVEDYSGDLRAKERDEADSSELAELRKRIRALKDSIAEQTMNVEDLVEELQELSAVEPRSSTRLPAHAAGRNVENLLARQIISSKLPKFDGDPIKWRQFVRTYERTSEQLNLTDEENVSRLQAALDGVARHHVRHMLDDPERVGDILATLERRFGSHMLALKHALQKMEQAGAPNLDRPRTVIDFAEAVADLHATVARNADRGNDDHLLLNVEKKLSPALLMQWETYRMITGKATSIVSMQEWTSSLADNAWKAISFGEPSGVSEKPTSRVRVHNVAEQRERTCFACRKPGHSVYDCPEFRAMTIEKRRETVRANRLCNNCLYPGHRTDDCRSKQRCTMLRCGARHHPYLHAADSSAVNVVRGAVCGFAPVIPVLVSGPYGTKSVYAFIDTGSNMTFIDPDIAAMVGAYGPQRSLHVDGFYSKGNHVEANVVDLRVAAADGGNEYVLKNVLSAPVPLGMCKQNAGDLHQRFPYAADVVLESFAVKPQLLLGSCHSFVSEAQRVIARHTGEPRFYECRLGWYVMGPKPDDGTHYSMCAVRGCQADTELSDVVKQFIVLDDIGVRERPARSSVENERSLEIMQRTTRRVGPSSIETGLLWRSDVIKMPDNYNNALMRLRCLERQMDRDPTYADAVRKKIADIVAKGYLAKTTLVHGVNRGPHDWYIPMFGVTNVNKPGKIRLVADCAAETKGWSLNKALLSGPDLNNSLVGVLLRFRRYRHAVVADVEEMFHRVFIRPEDRCAQRILWRDGDSTRVPDVYEYRVMTFGATCSPACAQFVKNWNADEQKEQFPTAARAIQEQFYVDDYLDSFRTEKEAIESTKAVYDVQMKGGFKTRGWLTNNPAVLKHFAPELLSTNAEKLVRGGDERVLGLLWRPADDVFQIVARKKLEKLVAPTKRQALSHVMALYDPLGIAGYVSARGKILLQNAWRVSIGWDDPLPDHLLDGWRCYQQTVEHLANLSISRMYTTADLAANRREMHVFCDASEEAYAAVVYLRVESPSGTEVSIVYSKSRVAPLKPATIPRLELQAALLGVRIADYVQHELMVPLHRRVYWSDSMTALAWIGSESRRYAAYVSNRVAEILESTDVSEWRWVPTGENPADIATRNTPLPTVPSRWFRGPQFLTQTEEAWPSPRNITSFATGEEERPRVMALQGAEQPSLPSPVRFSRLETLLRVTACTARQIGTRGPFTTDELDTALLNHVRLAQTQSFGNEIVRITEGRAPKGRLKSVEVRYENGLLRAVTRLVNADYLPADTVNPYVLDGKHPVAQLIIMCLHRRRGHQGHETVKYELRKRFYVIGVTAAVKQIVSKCQLCILRKALPKPPRMSDLPTCRLRHSIHPFQSCGLDYFGPFTVKVGRRREKRWGAIFTCLSTRAVHLEIAASLSADSALQAVQRLSNRRGAPETIFCDNGTNFHGAETELQMARQQTRAIAEQRGINFKFIPPSAPHMGGAWERLIRSVKTVLSGLLFDRAVSDESAYTLFTEVEWTLNSRPLTPVSSNPHDDLPITPNHFLLAWRSGNGAPLHPREQIDYADSDLYGRRQWKTAQRLADLFWQRWVKEYLPQIAGRSKWRETPKETIAEGDVVLIVDPDAPRNIWRRGVVVRNHPGADGVSRVADVRTEKGMLRRPMTRLCKIVSNPTEGDAE